MIIKHIERWESSEGHDMTTTLEWNPLNPSVIELVDADTWTLDEWRHGMSRPRLVESLLADPSDIIPRVEDVELHAVPEKGVSWTRFTTRPHRADRRTHRLQRAIVDELLDESLMVIPLDLEGELATWKRQDGRWRWIPEHAGCDDKCPCGGANSPSGARG